MTGQATERPNELITRAPVTLRRFRADDLYALFQAVTESLDHLRPPGGHGHRRGLAPDQVT
jgi:hypothetical protein